MSTAVLYTSFTFLYASETWYLMYSNLIFVKPFAQSVLIIHGVIEIHYRTLQSIV